MLGRLPKCSHCGWQYQSGEGPFCLCCGKVEVLCCDCGQVLRLFPAGKFPNRLLRAHCDWCGLEPRLWRWLAPESAV